MLVAGVSRNKLYPSLIPLWRCLMRRHSIPALLSVLSVLICFGSVVPGRCEVIHGIAGLNTAIIDFYPYGLINDESFDFSTQTVVPTDTGDLFWKMDEKGDPWLVLRQCYATRVPGPLGSLQVAPSPIGGPLLGELRYDNGPGIYVIQTSDGLYVKFRCLGYIFDNIYFLKVEYYVQTDGSPSFGPVVAVEPTTWGKVKALYR
jgi:hypothetical protein